MHIFSLALVVVELWVILQFFTKWKFQKISMTHAATWQHNLEADIGHYVIVPNVTILNVIVPNVTIPNVIVPNVTIPKYFRDIFGILA